MKKYLIIFLLIFLSCKKEKNEGYQTIYPLPYLPVYPGSSWKYFNENGDTTVMVTEPGYILNNYESEKLGGKMTDKVYVPFWNGEPVYGYSTPKRVDHWGGSRASNVQVGYLSQKLGDTWGTWDDKDVGEWRTVVNVDTVMTIYSLTFDHVIIVADYERDDFTGGITHFMGKCYYAKDVGLIQKDEYPHHLKIISYHINK